MERYLVRMIELLDVQQQNCIDMGAKIDKFSLAPFHGGDKETILENIGFVVAPHGIGYMVIC